MGDIFEKLTSLFDEVGIEQMHVFVFISVAVLCILVGYLCYRFYRKGKELQEEEAVAKFKDSLEDSFRQGNCLTTVSYRNG